MTFEESAGFSDMLVTEALGRGNGSFSGPDLLQIAAELRAGAQADPPHPSWLLTVALARLAFDLYLDGELDTNVEGCLDEALRVLTNSITDLGGTTAA